MNKRVIKPCGLCLIKPAFFSSSNKALTFNRFLKLSFTEFSLQVVYCEVYDDFEIHELNHTLVVFALVTPSGDANLWQLVQQP